MGNVVTNSDTTNFSIEISKTSSLQRVSTIFLPGVSITTRQGAAQLDVLERLPDGTAIEALEGYSLGWPSGAAGGVAGA
jgi:hypothetical protein